MSASRTSPTLEDFENFLDKKVEEARKVDGPSIANQDQWGNPRTDPRWTDATWATNTHLTMWNNVVTSEDFAPWAPIVVFENSSAVGESLETAVASLIRRWHSLPRAGGRLSSLPSWDAFYRKGTLARACYFFIQSMGFGANLHSSMTSRRFVALRDMVATPNGLPPMLIPMPPAQLGARTPIAPPTPNSLKRKSDYDKVRRSKKEALFNGASLVRYSPISQDRRAHEEWSQDQYRLIDKILADESPEEANTQGRFESQKPNLVDMASVKKLIDERAQVLESQMAARIGQMEARIRAETRAACHAIIGSCMERIRDMEERHTSELNQLAPMLDRRASGDQLGGSGTRVCSMSDGKTTGREHIKLESIEKD